MPAYKSNQMQTHSFLAHKSNARERLQQSVRKPLNLRFRRHANDMLKRTSTNIENGSTQNE